MSVGEVLDRKEIPPMVKYERRAIEDKPETRKQGRIVYKDIDFALVVPPYSRDCHEQEALSWLKNVEMNVRKGRTPPEWYDHWKNGYEKFKRGEEMPLDGTSVKNWPAISQAQCKTLIAAGILTIERLAQVNDEGLRRLGMGGIELKNKAIAFLKDDNKLVVENAALKKENDQLKLTIDSINEKMETMRLQLSSMQAQPITEVGITGDDLKIDWSNEPIIEKPGEDTVIQIETESPMTLVEQYIEKFGKKPHHLMKEETIRRKLEE